MESKICTKCNKDKPISQYWKQSKAKDKLNTWCKDCVVNGLKEGARNRKKAAIALFGGVCYRCGQEHNPAVFDFHHKESSDKEFGIAKLLQSLSLDNPTVKLELEKCILLCSNCHRIVHATEENPVLKYQ